jgi:hypothetical protein
MSFLVFPSWVYVIPCVLLIWSLVLTVLTASRNAIPTVMLACPVIFFLLALMYNSWRAFAFFHGEGGTGGWYAWAIALPEILLLTQGARARRLVSGWILPVLGVFLILTVLGDAALFLDSTGRLVTTSHNHIVGVAAGPILQIVSAYAESRPLAIGLAAGGLAVGSWFLAGLLLLKVHAASPSRPWTGHTLSTFVEREPDVGHQKS